MSPDTMRTITHNERRAMLLHELFKLENMARARSTASMDPLWASLASMCRKFHDYLTTESLRASMGLEIRRRPDRTLCELCGRELDPDVELCPTCDAGSPYFSTMRTET